MPLVKIKPAPMMFNKMIMKKLVLIENENRKKTGKAFPSTDYARILKRKPAMLR
jgi:hypothetical protein